MEHTLVLVRHAQAKPHALGGDHARPLSAYGNEQARNLAVRLARIVPSFDIAIYSDALRTTETAAHLLHCCPADTTWADRGIYVARAQDILGVISSVGEARRVLIVGHEPTISELGRFLAADPTMIRGGIPTATALVLRHDSEWAELGSHQCSLDILSQS